MYNYFFKRMFDIALSSLFLLIFWPVLLVIWLAVRLDSPGDAIFRQRRIGFKGQEFEILKFRSMYMGAEKQGSGVYSGKGDPRVTRIGRIIRATSLDELPQVWNVLKGNMSFIGPRPPLTYHPWTYDHYTSEQKRMFEVRPGVTGWAQVHGRKDVEWHQRINMNVWYVDHVSLGLDLKILFMTVVKVILNADNANIKKTV